MTRMSVTERAIEDIKAMGRRDYACKFCQPSSAQIVPGFLCLRHRLQAAMVRTQGEGSFGNLGGIRAVLHVFPGSGNVESVMRLPSNPTVAQLASALRDLSGYIGERFKGHTEDQQALSELRNAQRSIRNFLGLGS